MIVLLLIMIWLSMLCNLWLLFRINMLDEDIEKIYKRLNNDVKDVIILNGRNDIDVEELAKEIKNKIK